MSGLLEHSRILIYGRPASGVSIDSTSKSPAKQLVTAYGFEFEGHYYDLPAPAMFVLEGKPQTPKAAGAVVETDPRLSSDIQVWTCDKGDFSTRLDVISGPLEDILLDETIEDESLAAQTSGKRISGKRISGKRVSGKRMSGD